MQRLSTLYNADVGLYMLANKWMVDKKELRVIHYTLGPLKPWDWWTAWLVKPVDVWQEIRQSLKDSLPGTAAGSNLMEDFIVKFLFLLPFLILLFWYCRLIQAWENFGSLCRSPLLDCMRHLCYRIKIGSPRAYTCVSPSSAVNANQQVCNAMLSKVPGFLVGLSIAVCFMSVIISLGLALLIIPRQVTPWTGLILMYELAFTIFFVLFGGYLQWIYLWGKMRASHEGFYPSDARSLDDDSGKGHLQQVSFYDTTEKYYWLAMAFLAVAVPSLPFLLGIAALFVRLGLMVAGGMILAAFMAYSSEHLAIKAFLRGLKNRDMARTRNLCWFC